MQADCRQGKGRRSDSTAGPASSPVVDARAVAVGRAAAISGASSRLTAYTQNGSRQPAAPTAPPSTKKTVADADAHMVCRARYRTRRRPV
jgi:hypothetical protein